MNSRKQKYHYKLRQLLGATNSPKRFATNKAFDKWNYYLQNEIWNRFAARAKKQPEDIEKERELVQDCKSHIKRYSKLLAEENVLVFTHPLYAHLTHAEDINTKEAELEFDSFNYRLFGILNQRSRREDFGVVLIEDPRYYAAATSLLLERGLVNDTFLTDYDSGCLRDKKDLDCLIGKNIFVGGAYNGHGFCLKHSVEDIEIVVPKEQIWAIKDLIMEPDWNNPPGLCPNIVSGVDASRTITLEQFLEKLSLK